ncbi:MAG TPA: sulfotransferase [Acidimicrobiia bacterium]|jgi:hypothetical protein|nr:sulfotransferase [Acidimicrobiia bacterium]
MAKRKLERGFDAREVARRRTIWDKGPLNYVPNKYLRRPIKVARAGVTVPSMLWNSRDGGVDDLRLPDFLGIGGARCGSTWLHFNLDAHPDVCMPATKELRFWNNNLGRGLKAYSSNFDCKPGDVAGEITPAYGVMDAWRVRLMARVLPEARLVYLIRNPIDRSWSHLSLWARNRGLAVNELSHDQIVEGLTSDEFTRNATYTQTYRIYSEAFGRNQIFVGFYEDVEQKPRELLQGIFEHIGVATDVNWDELPMSRRFNSGMGYEEQERTTTTTMPDEYRAMLAKRYEIELRHLAQTFRGHAEQWAADAAAFVR